MSKVNDYIEFESEDPGRQHLSTEEREHQYKIKKLTSGNKILLALGIIFGVFGIADIALNIAGVMMSDSSLFDTVYSAVPNAVLLIIGFYFGKDK